MSGGRGMLTCISTAAIVGIGNTKTNAKSNVPQSAFFILSPPYTSLFCLPLAFPVSHNQQHDAVHERNSPHNGRLPVTLIRGGLQEVKGKVVEFTELMRETTSYECSYANGKSRSKLPPE